MMGEKMQLMGGSPAACGEGEAAFRRPVVLVYLLSFPAPSRAGACGEEGRAVRRLPHPASSWGHAWGHCAQGRRDSGSALGFWGQCGGSRWAEPCSGPWGQHRGCVWLHASRIHGCAGAALAGAVGKLTVRGCSHAGCPSWGCKQDTRAGRSPLHPGWASLRGRSHPPLPKPQPRPVALLQPVFNKLSWVFLVLFLITAIILSLFPSLPLSCRSLLPCCLGSPMPLNLQPDPVCIQVALKVFWLAGCPAQFKFKASHMWMGGPNTESSPKREPRAGAGSRSPPGQGPAAGLGAAGAAPFPVGLCTRSPPLALASAGGRGAGQGGSWLHTECVLVLLQGR